MKHKTHKKIITSLLFAISFISFQNAFSEQHDGQIFSYEEICDRPAESVMCVSPSTMYYHNGLCYDLTPYHGRWMGVYLENNENYNWLWNDYPVASGKDLQIPVGVSSFTLKSENDGKQIFKIAVNLQNPTLEEGFNKPVDQQSNICILNINKIKNHLKK